MKLRLGEGKNAQGRDGLIEQNNRAKMNQRRGSPGQELLRRRLEAKVGGGEGCEKNRRCAGETGSAEAAPGAKARLENRRSQRKVDTGTAAACLKHIRLPGGRYGPFIAGTAGRSRYGRRGIPVFVETPDRPESAAESGQQIDQEGEPDQSVCQKCFKAQGQLPREGYRKILSQTQGFLQLQSGRRFSPYSPDSPEPSFSSDRPPPRRRKPSAPLRRPAQNRRRPAGSAGARTPTGRKRSRRRDRRPPAGT